MDLIKFCKAVIFILPFKCSALLQQKLGYILMPFVTCVMKGCFSLFILQINYSDISLSQ